jgi:hypothetical protein
MLFAVTLGRDDAGATVVLIEARIEASDTDALAAVEEYRARVAAGQTPEMLADAARALAVPLAAAIVAGGG